MGKLIKYIADRLVATITLIILSPLIIVVGLLIRLNLGSPIFFTQLRPGKNGEIFTFYKFRTMTDKKDTEGKLLPDSERMTPFGSLIRKTSLDELPQLLNVLNGDMSLVGPRPLMVHYLELYNSEQKRRHDVLPGITGLAQTSGRNSIDWDKRLKLDVSYVDNWSLWLDFNILLATVVKVIKRDGISQEGQATCEDFGDYLSKLESSNS